MHKSSGGLVKTESLIFFFLVGLGLGLSLCISNEFAGDADLCRPNLSIKEFKSSSHRASGGSCKTVFVVKKERSLWGLGWMDFYIKKLLFFCANVSSPFKRLDAPTFFCSALSGQGTGLSPSPRYPAFSEGVAIV